MKRNLPVLILMLMAQPVLATPLTLSPGSGADFDAATFCIFNDGGNSCPLLVGSTGSAPTDTPSGAPGASYSGDSWTYTVGELVDQLGGDNTFDLVIDSNWASPQSASDYLDLFQVLVNGAVEFDYTGSMALNSGANGTGNENWLLSTVDLSTFGLGDLVTFHLEMSGLTDGGEQIALQTAGFVDPPDPCEIDPQAPGCVDPPNPCEIDPQAPGCVIPTPEPGTLLLLTAGLFGLVFGRRRIY